MITQVPRQLTRRSLLKSGSAAVPAIAGAASVAAARETGPSAVPGSLAQNAPAPDEELVAGNTAFALDLYAAVRPDSAENLLFSPYSISQALAMAYAGARGETAAQMAETLAFRLDQPALHKEFSALNSDLVARGNEEENLENQSDWAASGNEEEDGENLVTVRALRIANGMWGEQTYPFSEAYSEELQRYYWAGLQMHDLINAPKGVRHQVNGWVAEQTHDRIQDIVPEGAITSDSRLVFANAIWFFGGWDTPFDSDKTQDGEFFLIDGATVTVPFMVQQVGLGYARGDGFQVVELPLRGQRVRIHGHPTGRGPVRGGRGGAGRRRARRRAQSTRLCRRAGVPAEVRVRVRHDRPQTDAAIDGDDGRLRPGARRFLGHGGEDTARTAPPRLRAAQSFHQRGRGRDGSGGGNRRRGGYGGDGGTDAEPLEVRVDRPFLFAIRDTETGTLLFLGRVMDPSV